MGWKILFSLGWPSFLRWCLNKNIGVEALQTHPSVYEWIMSTKQIETNDLNGSRLAEQGTSFGRCFPQWNSDCHHANPVISKRRKWSSPENKIVIECYLSSEPKTRGYRKRMLSSWLKKNVFWVSEHRLVDQANTIHRNCWMTELEIEELVRNLAEMIVTRRKKEVLMIQVIT